MLCLLVYNANLRQIGSGDTLPARYQPLGIWHYGTLELDRIERWVAHGHSMIKPWKRPANSGGQVAYFEPWTYWLIKTDHGHLVSLFPVVAPILVAPLYLPAVAWLNHHGWQQPYIDRLAEMMEKISASIIATIATVIMFLLLRREGNRWSLGLVLAFAFGTNNWMISSQALWQHGAGALLIAIALLLSIAPLTPIRATVLGVVCVAMAANRPPDAFIAGAFLFYAVWTRWRSAGWLLAGAALPLAALLMYNVGTIGSLAGGYGYVTVRKNDFFGNSVWSGLAGLLVSPARGLLVFMPFLMFVPIGLLHRLRDPDKRDRRALAVALGIAIVAQILLYARTDWRSGTCWGPRFLTDILPILVWLVAPAPLVMRSFGRGLLVLSILISVAVQAIGAFWYTKTSDQAIFADSASFRGAWDVHNTPFFAELRHPPSRGELQRKTEGLIDHVGLSSLSGLEKTPPMLGPESVIEGWTLAGRQRPAQILLLIDGIVIGSAQKFQVRQDVNVAKKTNSPSGWHVVANMRGVEPGERVLQLAVRVYPRSDIRIVCEQRVIAVNEKSSGDTVAPGQALSLDEIAHRAAAMLRTRQDAGGYWLTSYTTQPRFENPQPEMNTYLTSMLVDLLSPIANQYGLDEVVERARAHLHAQIESDGLVRYHGLPDGPTIGKLGCVITPDADDTALAWRIAGPGPNDPRRERMLQTLAQYRDGRGLYRTWLAPRDRYECVDPGRDPNPADATIQMHIYMMLRKLDPPAAVSLCGELKRHIDDNDVWVYYDKAPLVTSLRRAELRQLDCDIALPSSRLAHAIPGQEVWSEAARRVVEIAASAPNAIDRKSIFNLLAAIGNNDFDELHRTPPLLYHNDLTATVPRYYWSEDLGHALWLRLYQAASADAGPLTRKP